MINVLENEVEKLECIGQLSAFIGMCILANFFTFFFVSVILKNTYHKLENDRDFLWSKISLPVAFYKLLGPKKEPFGWFWKTLEI